MGEAEKGRIGALTLCWERREERDSGWDSLRERKNNNFSAMSGGKKKH